VAAQIDRLEKEVAARGFNWRWGQRPPSTKGAVPVHQSVLCSSCSGPSLRGDPG
jgi:hypothetical protein